MSIEPTHASLALSMLAVAVGLTIAPGVAHASDDDDDGEEAPFLPVLHVNAGPSVDLSDSGGDLLVTGGVNLGFSYEAWAQSDGAWGLWISPELGYVGHGVGHDELFHAGMLGFGFGIGNSWAFASITPRFSLGAIDGDIHAMLSSGLTGHFLREILRAEIAHELLLGDKTKQFFTATLSVDLVTLVMAFASKN
ncbi:MAG: hypothetical protein U0271_06315 [Polyangiaceae bacterium]